MSKEIVLYPVVHPTGGGDVYESLPVAVDGVPGCIVSVVREQSSDVWQGKIIPPAGVRETPGEGFVFGDYLLETTSAIHRRPLAGVPGYDRLAIDHAYCWRFDTAGLPIFVKNE